MKMRNTVGPPATLFRVLSNLLLLIHVISMVKENSIEHSILSRIPYGFMYYYMVHNMTVKNFTSLFRSKALLQNKTTRET